MLDLIEYLARWVARPAADRLPGPRRAARPPAGWGGGRLNATTITLDPLAARARAASSSRRCSAKRPATASSPSEVARALGRQPAVRRGDGQPDRRGGRRPTPRRCRRRSTRCSPPGSTRCRASSAALLQAAVGGRPDLLGGLGRPTPRDERAICARRSSRCGTRTWSCRPPAAGWPASASTRSSTC